MGHMTLTSSGFVCLGYDYSTSTCYDQSMQCNAMQCNTILVLITHRALSFTSRYIEPNLNLCTEFEDSQFISREKLIPYADEQKLTNRLRVIWVVTVPSGHRQRYQSFLALRSPSLSL